MTTRNVAEEFFTGVVHMLCLLAVVSIAAPTFVQAYMVSVAAVLLGACVLRVAVRGAFEYAVQSLQNARLLVSHRFNY